VVRELDVPLSTRLPGEVRLRRLTPADAEVFAAGMAADLDRMSEFLPWPALTATPEGAAAFLARYEGPDGGRKLAAGAWHDGALVAGMVLFRHDELSAQIEIGCWSLGTAEGHGVVRAACVEGLRIARGWGIERVEWRCSPDNMRSGGLARRLGFTLEGRLRSSYVLRDQRLDTEVYGLVGREIDRAISA
jgi:RimJ/RimL family protein N-acetyltransferase